MLAIFSLFPPMLSHCSWTREVKGWMLSGSKAFVLIVSAGRRSLGEVGVCFSPDEGGLYKLWVDELKRKGQRLGLSSCWPLRVSVPMQVFAGRVRDSGFKVVFQA